MRKPLIEHMLSTPLFLGMTTQDLKQVINDDMLSFSHVNRNITIAAESSRCDRMAIICDGTVEIHKQSDDNSYSMREHLPAPLIIQPERLFGLSHHYSATFTTVTPCSIILLGKPLVMRLIEQYEVFRINMLNMLSTMVQRQGGKTWHQQSDDIETRIIRFIADHCLIPTGKKRLDIKMVTLARELGCARLEVSKALHNLEEKELLISKRGFIDIPNLPLLLRYKQG